MSISKELASQLQDKPAVVCCRTTKGTVLAPADLEDPNIFADLEESGLLTLTPDTLTIGEVLGATLLKDIDGLTNLTAEVLSGVTARAMQSSPAPSHSSPSHSSPAQHAPSAPALHAQPSQGISSMISGGMLHIKADQITGLELSLPLGVFAGTHSSTETSLNTGATAEQSAPKVWDEVVETLEKRFFSVKEVRLGRETSFENGLLTIREGIDKEALEGFALLKDCKLTIIQPNDRHIYSDTIMDVIPIATKVEGEIGSGITNCMSDVVFLLAGVDEDGTQVHEFGSSDGYLDEEIIYGRPGCPDEHDIIIHVHCTLQRKVGMERRGPLAVHSACDHIIQEIRNILKKAPAEKAAVIEKCDHVIRHGRPRVLLVKEIMGQGAMHDNILLPSEPAGVPGGRPNVDLGNVPVAMSVNEVRDGAIHALCCIGPASKEMTRHYFREPLLERLANDQELNLVGVIFIGSPQVNDEKNFVSKRLGAMVELMQLDGAIVTTEGFGNNHIDFASNISEIGRRGIKVVGCSYSAYQGQLIVGNPYMDALVELNKDATGFESEKLGENTLIDIDAKRAIAMLKNKLAGVPIVAPVNKWDQTIIDTNKKLVGGK